MKNTTGIRYQIIFTSVALLVALLIPACTTSTAPKTKSPQLMEIEVPPETGTDESIPPIHPVEHPGRPDKEPKTVVTDQVPSQKPGLQPEETKTRPETEISIKPVPPETTSLPGKTPENTKPIELAISRLVPSSPNTDPFLSHSSFVTRWRILGPFPFPAADAATAINHPFLENEESLDSSSVKPEPAIDVIREFDAGESEQPGKIDLNRLFKNHEPAAAYAVATLDSPVKMTHLQLHAGSSCHLKIWLNGKLVHTYNHEPRKADWDQDTVSNLTFKEGYNSLVVKTSYMDGPWEFYLRFSDSEGIPVCIGQKDKPTSVTPP